VNFLIVTADDVGLHRGMTMGAIRAHRQGIVTACSVAGVGEELAHAAAQLQECPALDVGVHLTLVGTRPVSDPARIPSLVTRGGAFGSGYAAFAARWALGRVSIAEVEIELRAQIERVMAAGLSPCHVNGHQHLHVLPGLCDLVVRLALDYGIPYLRSPDDRLPAGPPTIRRGSVGMLSHLARRAAGRARAAGLHVNTRTIGILDAGHLTAARLRRLVRGLDGITELVAHPGLEGPRIGRAFEWGYDWDAETDALCDPSVAHAIAREGVILVGVRGVVERLDALAIRTRA
jgi:predicted glycoside hydrolase/deacetylase ChbG (UPF0249 family)